MKARNLLAVVAILATFTAPMRSTWSEEATLLPPWNEEATLLQTPAKARLSQSKSAFPLPLSGGGPGWGLGDKVRAQQAQNVEFVGHIGGVTRAVAVQGNYAYIGEGPRLTILDISDPASPTVVGKMDPLPDIVRGVAVAGDYAYVADGYYGGLRVVDVSDPSNPTEAGSYDTPGYAWGVAVAGGYAYVADGLEGLRVVDVSHPSNPAEVGSYDTVYAMGVAVAGDYAYVADGGRGLRVMDVSDPSNPQEVGACDTPDFARGVVVAGEYAYVADEGAGLCVVDVSDPYNPAEVGFYDTPGWAYGVAVAEGYAYVADGGAGLRVVDVSDPSNPTEVGFYDTPGDAWGVAVAGDYAYVADGGAGLRVVDVSDPSNPTEVGFYDTPGYAKDVAVARDYAYVADGYYGGLRVVDVSDPSNPQEVGSYDTPGYAWGVAVAWDYAYVAGNSGYPDYDGWLRVVDVSDPTNPTEVGYYDTPGWAWDVAVAGRYAYVADYYSLRVVDVSDPSNPREVGACGTPGWAVDVAVAGDYAYVADYYSLRVVDVSDPSNPQKVGACDTPESAVGVAVAGDYAYVADRGAGLRVVDISDPSNPEEVGACDTPGYAWSVSVAGGYAYVADGSGGMFVLRFTGVVVNNPPNQPTGLSQFKSDGITSIPFGGTTDESTVVLKGDVSDPDGDQVRLQVELRRLDEYGGGFTGEPTHESDWVESGSQASITVYGLINADYHWRARAIDSNGATSSWMSAGNNPDSDADFRVRRLYISHIEVTQAIQDENNSVLFIAGKPTFVRVYVDCGEGCTPLPNVTGVLRGYGPSGELEGSPLQPVNRSIIARHEDWRIQRRSLVKTLNFTLPMWWCTGTVTLTAEVNGATHSETVTFQSARRPRIIYVPINYEGQLPDMNDIAVGHTWASMIYPTHGINYIRSNKTIDWGCPFWDLPCHILPEGEAQRLLNELTNECNMRDDCDYIYGWLPEGTLGDGGMADPKWDKGAGKAAFGENDPTEGRRIFAHEIAHLMGRRHTNTQDNLNRPRDCALNDSWRCFGNPDCRAYVDPDSDWVREDSLPGPPPFPDSTIQDYGLDGYGSYWLDSLSFAVKDPDDTYDYMSYCGTLAGDNVWTSPWTYEHIYSETLSTQTTALALQPLSTPQPYFIASGLVYTDNTATLDPIWVITKTVTPRNPPEGTQYCLEAQDASGVPLVSRCFDLTFVNYETGEATNVDGFNLMLPYPSGVARIVLKKGTEEIAVQLASANAPIVTVLSPNGGESWSATGTYTITWSASDADGDPLTYRVLYSPDGSKWVPVSSIITQTQLAVNAEVLAGGTNALIRVMASDWVNTSSDESDDVFTVGRKPPSAYILSPESGITIQPNTPLLLQGYAYDLEDGVLEEGSLQWSSNIDGALGSGSDVLVILSSGQHIITFTAQDSDGNFGEAQISVYVGYKIYLPIVLKNW
jgi:hypothetical protein